MARIKINDLPKDMKISENEAIAIRGGLSRSANGIIIESGSFSSTVIVPTAVSCGCGSQGVTYPNIFPVTKRR